MKARISTVPELSETNVNTNSPLRVDFVERKRFPGQFSIEASFDHLAATLRDYGVVVRRREAPVHSKGLLNRLKIGLFAAWRTNADIVHVTGDIHFAVLTSPRPVVLTIHDLERLGRLSGLRKFVFRLFWFQLPCRRADRITVVSDATRRGLLEEFPHLADKVDVIPTLVSNCFRYVPPSPFPNVPMVLQVGTKPNKNLPRLAEAMKGLNARLVVVGKVDTTLAAVFHANNLRVETHCDVSEAEMASLYASADVVTLVSTEEGFGMPIIEAQKVGRPILTSNISSMPEVAGTDGAYFVDPYDVTAIRSGLLTMFSDPDLRKRLISTGLVNVKRFDANVVTQQLLSVYSKLDASR